MKRNIAKAATRFVLLVLFATALTQQALANSYEGDSSHVTPVATFATTNFAPTQGQSGFWARVVARDASVRDRPGGRVLQILTNGQFFHVYPSYKNPSWYLGYSCPRGNRGCSNRQSTPGYIMRNTVSGAVAFASPAMPNSVGEGSLVAVGVGTDNSSPTGDAFYVPAFSVAGGITPAILTALQGQERRICAREVWMRNDRLWPIDLLRAGDRFIVERYTDGSKSDGNARWAIGRAKNHRGRVLVSAFCS